MKTRTFLPAMLLSLLCIVFVFQGCKKVWNPCPKDLVPFLKDDIEKLKLTNYCTDAKGFPYEMNNMLIEFADTVSAWRITALEALLQPDEIEHCLCDKNIQNWKWDESQIIDIEEKVGQVAGQSKGEGDFGASPNYLNFIFNPEPSLNVPFAQFPEQGGTGGGLVSGTDSGMLIAILDTGLDGEYAREKKISIDNSGGAGCLPANAFGWNFVDNNINISDDHGHGTAVAGIMSESLQRASTNAEYTCGARFLVLKVLNSQGVGNIFDAICAMDMAVKAEAKVINVSWGYYGVDIWMVKKVMEPVAGYRPGVIVTSLGNDTLRVDEALKHYPSEYANVLSNVKAVVGDARQDIWDSLAGRTASPAPIADFSNYALNQPMLTAPSKEITVWAPQSLGLPGNQRLAKGTSYSAAYVSAASAVNLCCNQALPPDNALPLRRTVALSVNFAAGQLVLENVVLEDQRLCEPGGGL